MTRATVFRESPAKGPHRRRVVKSADQRRTDLLDAAQKLFAAKGFDNCTIDDIAFAAGAGKGTFYRQFGSKDHLLGALWQRYIDKISETVQAHLSTATQRWSITLLEAIFTEFIEVAIAHADLHRTIYSSANGPAHDMCREANQRVIEQLADYVQSGADAGIVHAPHPRFTLRVLYEGLDATLDQLIATDDHEELTALPEKYVELLRHTL